MNLISFAKGRTTSTVFVIEEVPITVSPWAPDKEARPSPYPLGPVLSSH